MDSGEVRVAAAAAAERISSTTHLGKRPRTLRGSNPDWVMLDCFINHLSVDDSSRTTLAYEFTSTGDLIGVGFRAAAPPGTSRLFFDWFPNANKKKGKRFRFRGDGRKDSSPWSPDAAKAVAAHRNSILLRFLLPTKGAIHEEFFIYRADPMTLTSLHTCGHTFINYDVGNNIGILCREDDGEFAVAHLTVTRKKGDWSSCPVTAQLCCMLSQDGSWRTKCLPIRHGEGKGSDLFWWETDVVIPFGDFICWVDYLRGILFCDVFSPNPELRYVTLPVCPYDGRRHPELGGRGDLFAYRSVSVTKDGALKFVDAATSDLWFSPGHFYGPSAVTSWTLSSDWLTWTEDGMIEVDKFFALTTCLNLPCIQPGFPLVDIKDPQTIYFALKEGLCPNAKALLIPVNMLRKTLGWPIAYALRSSLSSGEGDSYTASCNLFYNEPFLSCEFSKYLGLDVPDTSNGLH
uniref:Uncharacterized protein n=1 Tax=Arundo donax TaxID=35708 RepID=A0A0A8XSD9_ARUDO